MHSAPACTAIRYATFALIATATNLFTQEAAMRAYHGPWPRGAALASGTAVGLLVKYLLDSRLIFRARVAGGLEAIARLLRYVLTSVVTTGFFWAVELAFMRFLVSPAAPTIGGAIGLAAGYTLKYFLDSRLVFSHKASGPLTRRTGARPGGPA
jgi:putative flippase GtrA